MLVFLIRFPDLIVTISSRNMSKEEHWPNQSPKFSQDQIKLLLDDSAKSNVSKVSINDIIRNSESFPIDFPINSVKCEYLRNKGKVYSYVYKQYL